MNSSFSFFPAHHLSERLAATISCSASPLRLTAVRNSEATLVSVGGEIDGANVDTWRCVLADVAAATAAPGTLLVDARELDFMSSAGFAALAEQSMKCRRREIDLRLISTQPLFARIIAICGWHNEIPVYGSVDAALDARRFDRREFVSGSRVCG